MKLGNIHSIETFGTVDGPGIRYVLFLQGCILRCRYCHNRDTWEIGTGKMISPEAVIKDVLRYKAYYSASGGGLTISGGEPTIQAEFVRDVFKLAKQNNIHTCLDTSGLVDIKKIDMILEYTDLVLLDVKHISPEKSKWLTGYSSEAALKLALHLNEKNIPVWIRHVLVPSITDNKDDLRDMAEFLKQLNNVERFEFLPYHEMGKYKWKEFDEEYSLSDIRPANEQDVQNAKNIFIEAGYDNFADSRK